MAFPMMKRIFLFVAVNILVIATISLTLNLLHVGPYLTNYGIDYTNLLAFCAVVGFVGALFSLATSRIMAKFALGVKTIDPTSPSSYEETKLVETIRILSQKLNIPMPEVGIYESPEVNAFATGPTKSRALVAVSRGCLRDLDGTALEGVLGHEMSHVANGDMVTMTLIQGVINTFVLFFAKIAAWTASQALRGDRDDERGPSPWLYYLFDFLFQIAFSLLGTMVVMAFSRWREYRADRGSAILVGRDKMIHALEALRASTEIVDNRAPAVAALKINNRRGGLLALFSSHPPLENRIEALRNLSL